ncbi:MAG TPA: hypothetical protein VLC09_17730, partial [Polyangiaceae bacterium]|nr:hypothetical protein [Polyangiaceae bacterium]
MTPAELLALFRQHFSPRSRRVWISSDRAHVEVRGGDHHDLGAVANELTKLVRRHPEFHWAEVHQGTRRAVLAFQSGSIDAQRATALVLEAELAAGLARAAWPTDLHPASQENLEELFLATLVEGVGVLQALVLRMTPWPRSRLAATLASAVLLVRSIPRLRGPLDARFGTERTDLGLAMLGSLLEGPAQRPLTGVVGIAEKLAASGELRAQRRLFEAEESSLFGLEGAAAPREIPPRPVPLPRGPIDEYADRAWAVMLGSFAVSFVSTRSMQRAVGALFGGIPRPARLGREVFSSALSRLFASRHMLVLRRDKLRLLDRVDTLVIQGDLMPGSSISLGRVVPLPGIDQLQAHDQARALFDPKAPLALRSDGDLVLGPLSLVAPELGDEVREAARTLARGGQLVLGVTRAGQLEAIVEVEIGSRLGLEE